MVYTYDKHDIFNAKLSRGAKKDLKRVPLHIKVKLQAWLEAIGHNGLKHVMKIPGYHDEPLQGKRKSQRSIRLSKAYRAIYVIEKNERVKFIEVIEVNKHEY